MKARAKPRSASGCPSWLSCGNRVFAHRGKVFGVLRCLDPTGAVEGASRTVYNMGVSGCVVLGSGEASLFDADLESSRLSEVGLGLGDVAA